MKMLSKLTLQFVLVAALFAGSSANFYQYVKVAWGGPGSKIDEEGKLLNLTMDKISGGSGVESRNQYMFGRFDMKIKLIPGYSAGTVTTFYLSSQGDNHDEIDFEFLGNATGEPYTIHTNVYAQGKGNKEQQFKLWFNPAADFHLYSIIWNPQRIIYLVDNTPLRVYNKSKNPATPYPENQPMRMYSTLWNADEWATQGGRLKTNWDLAPFTASYQDLVIKGNCIGDTCDSESADPLSTQEWMNQDLDANGYSSLKETQSKCMIYDYCKDVHRFPEGLPEECAQ